MRMGLQETQAPHTSFLLYFFLTVCHCSRLQPPLPSDKPRLLSSPHTYPSASNARHENHHHHHHRLLSVQRKHHLTCPTGMDIITITIMMLSVQELVCHSHRFILDSSSSEKLQIPEAPSHMSNPNAHP